MSKGYYQLKPCPVCESESGKCRGKEDSGKEYILCMTFADSRKGQIENGYKCIKSSNNGYQHNSATFVIDNSQEWSEAQEEWETRKALRKADERLQEQAKKDNALSADERHRHYTKILNSLSLDAVTIADLTNRGFSQEEIENCGFKSLKNLHPFTFKNKDGENVTIYYKNLPFSVDARLPGVNKRGNALQVSGEGYLCPLRDYQGRIVALQLRLHNPDDSGRYRWVSTGKQTLALDVNGSLENPLTIFKPENPTGISIVEGTGVKPYLASNRLNSIVIGAAGGQFAGSPKLLEEYLQLASQDTNSKEIIIYPDAGDVKNQAVMSRWEQLTNLIIGFGYTVSFGWWGQVDKEDCDIDELQNLDNICYILRDDFKAIASEYQEEKINDWAWDMWRNSHRFSAISKQNDKDFKFPDIPESNAIIAVKSGLGTGKTEAFLKEIKKAKKGVRIIGYRNNLLHQTIGRGGEKGITIYHLNDDFGKDDHVLIQDENIHLAMCINSAHNEGISYDDCDIIIDESVSVLLHIIDGGTFSNFEQRRAMDTLESIVKSANRVFLLDGNLNDTIVDFIAGFDKNKKVIKIENNKKPEPHNIIFCDGVLKLESGDFELKPRAKSHLVKRMKEDDCMPFIATDSKKFGHELAGLLNKEGKKGIIISANTIAENYVKDFLKNPDKWILENKPQFVIITPSCESGVSIQIRDYFTHKFSFFCGVLGTSSQNQIMFRLRDNKPDHYVFCPHRTQLKDNTIPDNYTPRAIMATILDRINLSKLMAIDLANDKESASEIIAHLISSQKDDKWFDIGAKFWGLSNYEKQNLRKCLIYKLEESGHNVSEIQEEVEINLDDQLKEIKTELLEAEAQLMYNIEPFGTLEEAKKLEKKDNNLITNQKIKKTKMILERLPGIDKVEGYSVEFWENHLWDRTWISGHENYARLLNFDITMKQHEVDYHFKSTADYCFLAGMRSLRFSRIWALHELKILDLIKYNEEVCQFSEFSKLSPEVISLVDQINARQDLRIALGMTEPIKPQKNDKHIMETFKILLGYIGLGFGEPVQKTNPETKKKCRYYRIEPTEFNDSLRLAIVDITTQKDKLWLESDKSKVDWTQNKTVDHLASEIVGKFEAIQSYQEYEDIKNNELAKKSDEGRHHGLTTEQTENNEKIDKALVLAWEQLGSEGQDRILNLRIFNDPIAAIDSHIIQICNYNATHFNQMSSDYKWALRWEYAFAFGSNFFNILENIYSQSLSLV